jgi:hypothetical protein
MAHKAQEFSGLQRLSEVLNPPLPSKSAMESPLVGESRLLRAAVISTKRETTSLLLVGDKGDAWTSLIREIDNRPKRMSQNIHITCNQVSIGQDLFYNCHVSNV